jgi:hypothetical protein
MISSITVSVAVSVSGTHVLVDEHRTSTTLVVVDEVVDVGQFASTSVNLQSKDGSGVGSSI